MTRQEVDSLLQGGNKMLVLGRKRGESIVIGEGITVTVLEVRGDRVKLGFAASAEVPIHRAEVHQRIEDDSAVRVSNKSHLAAHTELYCPELQGASA
jgi:carbon storage regulator